MKPGAVFACALMGMCVLAPATARAQVFQGLGRTGSSNTSRAEAISADGTTVVGRTNSFDAPWRWTAGTGMQTFGTAPTGYTFGEATGVSQDGSTIVGTMTDGALVYAWRWTQSGGVQRVVGVGGSGTFGPHISADGSTIVGTAEGLNLSAVRWTQGTGAVPIGPVTRLPLGNGDALVAYAVSADGSVIAGSGRALSQQNPPTVTTIPFRWSQSSGAVGILDNGQFYFASLGGVGAFDLSADGSVMIGSIGASTWRWTMTTGFEIIINSTVLTAPPPRISGDAGTVVNRDYIWTQAGGATPLASALTSAGCDFTGWTNLLVADVSFDGRALCGLGTNPTGQTEAWYATVPGPGPTGLGLGSLMVLGRRRRMQA